jgi:hypothetical protein
VYKGIPLKFILSLWSNQTNLENSNKGLPFQIAGFNHYDETDCSLVLTPIFLNLENGMVNGR